MTTKILTVPNGAALSNGDSVENRNPTYTLSKQLFPVAIQMPSALTTDTSFVLEWEYSTGLWSEIRATNGASDPILFFANGTAKFEPSLAYFLKERTFRVKLATNQGAERVFTVHYGLL